MNILLVVTTLIGACLVLIITLLNARKKIDNETSRKLVHIFHGLVVASWIYTANYTFIISAELLFLATVLIARKFNILTSLRDVKRRSWGDIFFPIGIISISLFEPQAEVFLIAILHLALADALAALVGSRLNQGRYLVFGQRKTLGGTLTFFIVSLMITSLIGQYFNADYTFVYIIAVGVLTSAIENISPFGSDNLTIPLIVIGLLTLL